MIERIGRSDWGGNRANNGMMLKESFKHKILNMYLLAMNVVVLKYYRKEPSG